LLAGASAVQMASVFYKKGPEHIGTILNDLTVWMNEKGYQTISDFKGKLSLKNAPNPAGYERAQFMKQFNSDEKVIE
ncbi:MAG: diguanylate cyclase, partial [Bacteroidota bacterium]|nr:diguanylate cyclase [Bacteroidota bacterium]